MSDSEHLNVSDAEDDVVKADAEVLDSAKPVLLTAKADGQEKRIERNGKLYPSTTANRVMMKPYKWPVSEERIKPTTRKSEKPRRSSSPPYQRASDVSRSVLRYTVVMVLATLLLSRMMTETWTFGYSGRWSNPMNWIPRPVDCIVWSLATQTS